MKTIFWALAISLSFSTTIGWAGSQRKAKTELEQTGHEAGAAADSAGEQIKDTAHQFGKFGTGAAKDVGDSIKQVFKDSNQKVRTSSTPK